MNDQLDQPEEESYGLVVPFVVCQSQGGPYEDKAFAAGFACGEVDKALTVGAVSGATTVRFPLARTELLKQVELIAMHRGYPIMDVKTFPESPDWCEVTFGRGEDS